MIILNPGSTHDKLDYGDYINPGDPVATINNNPTPLS